jgi:hypothetical protein
MFQRNRSFERAQLKYLGHLTWSACTEVKKKAMDQEFTWSGFIISLSIAFFVVFGASTALNSMFVGSASSTVTKLSSQIFIFEKSGLTIDNL